MAKVVKNSKELEAAMGKVLEQAVAELKVVMNRTIEDFLKLWYDDYNQSKYVRTYQLLKAVTTTKVEKVGNKFKTQVYMNYENMHHMSYWDRLDKNGKPRPNRQKTPQEELMVTRMADGRDIKTGSLLPRDQQQRGISAGSLHENVIKNPGKHGVRFWTDAIDTLAGRGDHVPYSPYTPGTVDIFTAFEEYLRKRGFTVKRISHAPEYFMPLLY